jgi:5-methylcytosine-specific restriction endonuclease McrA
MPRTTISIIGALRYSEKDGLEFSVPVGKGNLERTFWMKAEVPNEHDWPGLGRFPERPNPATGPWPNAAARDKTLAANKAAEEEWQRACVAYDRALHADPKYRQAAMQLIELQNREPQHMRICWVYRNKVISVESTEPETLRDKATEVLMIKHYVLRRERHYEKVRREVEALENVEKLEGVSREPIPESVRLFVWQRDKGQCVKCGSRERLEFDHIIPVASGGSSTERNVQLLCESCNRSKGASV